MENKLFVFTTQRRIREFLGSFSNTLLPKTMSVGEFFSRCVVVKDMLTPSDAQLLIFMQEACKRVKQTQTKLSIPSEFFAFLKNNDYLFSFFKELATQKKSISELKFSDIYANYEEHLEILELLLETYKEILSQNGYFDEITKCENYEINENFIKNYDEIEIEIFGVLSEFEWEILSKISSITHLKISFTTSKLNKKLTDKIATLTDKEKLLDYHKYRLDFSDFSLENLGQTPQNRLVLTRAFSLASLQAAYVFEKISTFIKEGIDPKKIAVILPDENFAKILRLHDEGKMLSFAMGKPLNDTLFFRAFKTILTCLKEDLQIDFLGDDKQNLQKEQSFFKLINFKEELFNRFKFLYDSTADFDEFCAVLNELCASFKHSQVETILNEELFFMRQILSKKELKFSEACEILLMRLDERSIDDVGGGLVRVLGLLESRGLSFDGVIIVDFNDDLVPKRVVNEMFLSSNVRAKAGLISYLERENLQRSYYENLITNAKKVAISYVLNEGKIPSRFLTQFKQIPDTSYTDDEYLAIFSGKNRAKFTPETDFLPHDFFKEALSFSRLKTFLSCPRKYYYRYVLGLNEPPLFGKKSNATYGNAIHNALFDYYQTHKIFKLDDFLPFLSELNPLEFEIARQKFRLFEQNENAHISLGWQPFEFEVTKEAVVDDVKIKGVIDRIDRRNDEFFVIDYKTGTSNDPLQLEFYKYLANATQAKFYDLKKDMKFFEDKPVKKGLLEIFSEIRQYFKSPSYEQKFSACPFCPFFAICRGEIRGDDR